MHDELLGIECRGLARTAYSDPDVIQDAEGRWIAAEKMQPPSFWSTALDPVEEGAMALFQQSILEVLAMAIHDQGLTCKRT